jgi:hypothetical protein
MDYSLLGLLIAVLTVPRKILEWIGVLPNFEFEVFPDLYGSAKTLNLRVWNKSYRVIGGLPVEATGSVCLVAQDGKRFLYPDLIWSTGSGDAQQVLLPVDSQVPRSLQVLRVEDGTAFVPSKLRGTRRVPDGIYVIIVNLSYGGHEESYRFPTPWRVPDLTAELPSSYPTVI